MKMPSKRKIRGIAGLFMFSAFIMILCYEANPMSLQDFALSMAKAVGIVMLGVGGVWLALKR